MSSAIKRYNDGERGLYESTIAVPMGKLVEVISNRFRFEYTDLDELRLDMLSHCVSNLHKYKSSHGRSFSYFSTVAKNYAILQNNKGWTEKKKKESITKLRENGEESEYLTNITQKDTTALAHRVRLVGKFWQTNSQYIFSHRSHRAIGLAIGDILLETNVPMESVMKKHELFDELRKRADLNRKGKISSQLYQRTVREMKQWHRLMVPDLCVGKLDIVNYTKYRPPRSVISTAIRTARNRGAYIMLADEV